MEQKNRDRLNLDDALLPPCGQHLKRPRIFCTSFNFWTDTAVKNLMNGCGGILASFLRITFSNRCILTVWSMIWSKLWLAEPIWWFQVKHIKSLQIYSNSPPVGSKLCLGFIFAAKNQNNVINHRRRTTPSWILQQHYDAWSGLRIPSWTFSVFFLFISSWYKQTLADS